MSAKRTGSWLRPFLARHKGAIAKALVLGIIGGACTVLLMFTSGFLISATARSTTTLFSVMVPVAFVQLFGFGRPIARYLERLASHDWVLKLTSDLRLRLFRGAEERSGDPTRAKAAGEYLGLLSEDVAHLQNLYLRIVFPAVVAYALAIGACVAFGIFSPVIGGIMALFLAFVVVMLPELAHASCKGAAHVAIEARGQAYIETTDDIAGSTDWILSSRGAEAVELLSDHDAQRRLLDTRLRARSRLFSLASALLLGIAACAVISWAGTAFAAEPRTVDLVAAFSLGFIPLIEVFSALPQSMLERTSHQEAIERLGAFADPTTDKSPNATSPLGESGIRERSIAITKMSFTYPQSSAPTLKNLTLNVDEGQKLAILGRSGSGKSTLANLICGMFPPDAGSIRVAGYELGDTSLDLSEIVGFLGQEPYLFNRSLRENLDLKHAGYDDEAMIDALQRVGLGEKLASLPEKLDTVIGETGVGFSGGEAHRVALARILLSDTPVMVVDEPFSALDPETERDLLQTLFDTCTDRTLIVITHHLAQIDQFDRVIFLEKGIVKLDGSPNELLKTSPRFKRLVEFDR